MLGRLVCGRVLVTTALPGWPVSPRRLRSSSARRGAGASCRAMSVLGSGRRIMVLSSTAGPHRPYEVSGNRVPRAWHAIAHHIIVMPATAFQTPTHKRVNPAASTPRRPSQRLRSRANKAKSGRRTTEDRGPIADGVYTSVVCPLSSVVGKQKADRAAGLAQAAAHGAAMGRRYYLALALAK